MDLKTVSLMFALALSHLLGAAAAQECSAKSAKSDSPFLDVFDGYLQIPSYMGIRVAELAGGELEIRLFRKPEQEGEVGMATIVLDSTDQIEANHPAFHLEEEYSLNGFAVKVYRTTGNNGLARGRFLAEALRGGDRMQVQASGREALDDFLCLASSVDAW